MLEKIGLRAAVLFVFVVLYVICLSVYLTCQEMLSTKLKGKP